MSIADGLRVIALERTVAALLARVAVLEEMIADTPAQRPQSASADDAVIGALRSGQSVRSAARMLGLDRNRVFRARKRAIAEGCLTASPGETGLRKPTEGL